VKTYNEINHISCLNRIMNTEDGLITSQNYHVSYVVIYEIHFTWKYAIYCISRNNVKIF